MNFPFSDEESHLAWNYFEFRPAGCEYRVGGSLHPYGNSTVDCAFAGVCLTHLEPVTNMCWSPE